MRRSLLYLGIIIAIAGITFGLKVFAQQKPPEKRYNVTLPLQSWIQITNELEYIKGQLRQSDIPSKNVAFMSDSILTSLQSTIGKQVQDQLNAEMKKDTSKPKK